MLTVVLVIDTVYSFGEPTLYSEPLLHVFILLPFQSALYILFFVVCVFVKIIQRDISGDSPEVTP